MTRRGQGLLVALAVSVAIALASGGVAALAGPGGGSVTAADAVIRAAAGADRLIGTNGPDLIKGRGGGDLIRGRGGRDLLKGGRGGDRIGGGRGFDRIVGGRGSDRIRARDGQPDEIDCGPGRDVAKVDRQEDGVFDCERLVGSRARPKTGTGAVPHFEHVFIVVLENENAGETFGKDSEAPYLAHKLRRRGAFIPNYYATGHFSLDNYIAMVSGQAPNPETQADCQVFKQFLPGTPVRDGQYFGTGCVYPPQTQTVANQLQDAGYRWKGYMEDLNADAPNGEEHPCRHPGLNQPDHTQSAEVGDQYAARHNPFVYFHSIIDFRTCARHDVDFSHLKRDLRNRRTTPNYSFVTPNLCHDGHDAPCVNGAPGGLESANKWLRNKMPAILRSPAFKHRGLLIVTFDEAEAEGAQADSSACCNERPGPNLIPPDTPGGLHPGPGGGRIGAVMVSPCIKRQTVSKRKYNHYSLLRSIERNFHLPYLGYAAQAGLRPLGRDVLNRRGCGG